VAQVYTLNRLSHESSQNRLSLMDDQPVRIWEIW